MSLCILRRVNHRYTKTIHIALQAPNIYKSQSIKHTLDISHTTPPSTIPPPNHHNPYSPTMPPPSTRPVYFWRPHEEGTGYLGQWYFSPFTTNGDTYATCEMWMMVQKARLFGDEQVARDMLATQDPKTHKSLGRLVSGFDGKTWDESESISLLLGFLGGV